MNMLRRRPKKARRVDVVRCAGHKAYVRDNFLCIVPGCNRTPIQAMHIERAMDNAMSRKPSDDRVLPGCSFHHTDDGKAYHRIGREAFAKLHGLDLERLIEEINRNSGPLSRYRAKEQQP